MSSKHAAIGRDVPRPNLSPADTLVFPRLYLRLRFPGHFDAAGEPAEFSTFETWADSPRQGSRIVVSQVWHFLVTEREWHLGGTHRPTIQTVANSDAKGCRKASVGTEHKHLKFTPAEFEPVWRDYCAAIGAPFLEPEA